MSGFRVRDLAVARGGMPLLSGLSFEVAPGHALILAGHNGIGKTSLLRTLAGLQPPLAGEIAPGPQQVAYGAHSDGMKATLSVAENLSFWAELYGAGGIDGVIADFDLGALRDRAAQHLSAGQRRRLGLARMGLSGRPIWLLDEPTVSLDRASVARFGEALARHLGQGGIAVLASHVDLGIEAPTLDLAAFRARAEAPRGDVFADGAVE
ncbi:heme ABC exporter ATP-binding protein CcmA [Palleronia sp. LCG004]|uniref:heme ABC exporter ATP-binding protein CcmA n=1 Tax=Palleronia sp. LCG004 TaxID=3079304 RepID=UPI002941EDEF|nr:heme ABC exporter ATP-binding protein CcmA [Palleronia sp. LCG004]WOI54852.1 heme ABC exporter ATP-binding protein CcmA [Palleronia sp. LCG004]